MSRIERCPVCKGPAEMATYLTGETGIVHCASFSLSKAGCPYDVYLPTKVWNRIARLCRKGKMFEWLERWIKKFRRDLTRDDDWHVLYWWLRAARCWWRRKGKG